MRIVLLGNPNVGKSALFSQITGVHAVVSNYPGTTVEVLRGEMKVGDQRVEVIDAPGTYSLEPTCKAEEVAVDLLKSADVVVNVLDATNLERNLYLTLQLLERDKPVLVALNMWDETKHKGIEIDVARLEAFLRVPVVPTVAVTGEGVKELVARIAQADSPPVREHSRVERWGDIGELVARVQKLSHRHHTFLERLEDLTINPWPGIFIALLVIIATFVVVRFIGEGLISYALDPLASNAYLPFCSWLSRLLGGRGLIHQVLIGNLIDGQIDFKQSFGLLTTGVYVMLVMVLPYVVAFYLALGFLEDMGYLPRLAVLSDTLMHRIGMHGFAVLPMLLGLGCNVPGIMATRSLESERERFLAITLLSVAVPCTAMQAMVMGVLGHYGWQLVAMVFGVMFLVWLCLGFILSRVVKGFCPPLLLEIPPYRWPRLGATLKKLAMRVYSFVVEAELVVLAAIAVLNALYSLGAIEFLARLVEPAVSVLFGLPGGAVAALLLGLVRKDVAVGMLVPLGLGPEQMVVATTILAMFFPCVATFVMIVRELGWKAMLKMTGIMLLTATLVGSLLNLILPAV